MSRLWRKLEPFHEQGQRRLLNVIVETPKGQRNKFKYDPDQNGFSLSKVLPAGAVFPFDFGFVPGTTAEDGDPLDVVLLMDAPAFTGCWVAARLIGVIKAQQKKEDEAPIRNDRLLAVADVANDFAEIKGPDDVDQNLLQEYEHFFQS